MRISTVTTVAFKYPEEREQEITFFHDNNMDDWVQLIQGDVVNYIKKDEIQLPYREGKNE